MYPFNETDAVTEFCEDCEDEVLNLTLEGSL